MDKTLGGKNGKLKCKLCGNLRYKGVDLCVNCWRTEYKKFTYKGLELIYFQEENSFINYGLSNITYSTYNYTRFLELYDKDRGKWVFYGSNNDHTYKEIPLFDKPTSNFKLNLSPYNIELNVKNFNYIEELKKYIYGCFKTTIDT